MAFMDYMPQFGQNIPNQTVGAQNIPMDDMNAQLMLKRRLAQADALRNAEMPQGQMVSGHYVAPSWTQYLANIAGQYAGGKQEEQAIQDYSQAQASKAQKLGDLMKGKTVFETDAEGNQREVTKPYTNEELIGQLAGIDSSYAPKLFDTYLANRYKEKQGHVLTPGSTYFEDGKAVYTAPSAPKEHNLPAAVDEYKFAQSQGYRGSFEDWKKAQKNEGVTVNYGAPVAGVDKNGNPIFWQPSKAGGPPTIVQGITPPESPSAKPSEFEAKAGLYYKSMDNASKTLNDLETKGAKITPTYGEVLLDESTTAGKIGVSKIRTEERKSYVQAQKQWIDSINRVRSGANLPEIEYNRAVATFFPEVNDSPERIEQKRLARAGEEANMRTAAGRAMPNQPKQPTAKNIVRTGTDKTTGRKVVQYEDGTTAYAD